MDKLTRLNAIKRRAQLLLKAVIEDDLPKYIEEIKKIDLEMQSETMVYDDADPKSVLLNIDSSFEEVCYLLETKGVKEPKKLTKFEFEKRLSIIKEQSKPKQK